MTVKQKAEEKNLRVIPGDELATAEEYLPGTNAFEEEGKIFSAAFGKIRKDDAKLTISIETPRKKITPRVGDIVYGQVIKMDQRHSILKVGAICQKDENLEEYVREANIRSGGPAGRKPETDGSTVRIGDFVRAKIIKVTPFFDVSIMGKHYGAIRSLCTRCRNELVLKDRALYCENCERVETRKIADDYGNVLMFGDVNER